jgi:hemerythrin
MAIIKWRDSYDTGVDQFDREHHKIVELINTMFVAIRDKSDKDVTICACNDVLSYAQYHFANEEEAMQAVNYPGLEEHIAEHTRLKAEAVKFQTIISDNFPEGTTDFYRFLREWLVKHIEGCDMKYGPYLKSAPAAE